MSNVILIGMPGCGKSTAGVLLAKRIGYDFLDSDIALQARAGRKLQEILDSEGVDAFLKMEEQTLLSLEMEQTVLATGGSAVYSEAAMKKLSEHGVILYIRLPLEALMARLENLAVRGVALRPGQTMDQLFAERSVLYARYADAVIEAEGLDLEETVSAMTDALERMKRD